MPRTRGIYCIGSIPHDNRRQLHHLVVAGTLYPLLMADARGKADHGLAARLSMAMRAGFIRGVGFVPRHAV